MKRSGVIHEPEKTVPVLGEWEVVVCGGGPSGCAAAIAAARGGARTLLVEKEGHLGGAPVTQLVIPVLSTNGVDFQGVWHEWAGALKKLGGITEIRCGPRFTTRWYTGSVDPEMVKFAWDELLSQAGVELLHHALVAGAIVEDGTVRGVLVETRAGRRALLAERVVDCTGDAAVCAAAGVPYECGAHGKPWAMGVGKMWRCGGVPVPPGALAGQIGGGFGRTVANRMTERISMLRVLRIDPLDPWDLTRAEREARSRIWQQVQEKRKQPGFEGVYLLDTASNPGVRSSRRVKGLATAMADDAWNFRKYSDGIARSSWEIDIHSPEDMSKSVAYDDESYRPRIERAEAGDYFDIRCGCLVPEGVDNLLVAGRCISAEHEAQSSLRIQQTCMATGQAAGTAAAISLRQDATPRELDAMQVLAQLETDRAAVAPAFEILRDLPVAPREGQ